MAVGGNMGLEGGVGVGGGSRIMAFGCGGGPMMYTHHVKGHDDYCVQPLSSSFF